MILASAEHAINLNFDGSVDPAQWLLIDPSNLPGSTYLNNNLLADALLEGFTQKEGVVMETTLYTTTAEAKEMQSQFDLLKTSSDWKELHNIKKHSVTYGSEINQFFYALATGNIQWILAALSAGADTNQNILGYPLLEYVCSLGALEDIAELLDYGATVTYKALVIACARDTLDFLHLMIQKIPEQQKQDLWFEACKKNNTTLSDALITSLSTEQIQDISRGQVY